MLHTAHGTYGSLVDLAAFMDMSGGALKVARHRHPDTFPSSVGTIGNAQVYLLEDIEKWYQKRGYDALREQEARLAERIRENARD